MQTCTLLVSPQPPFNTGAKSPQAAVHAERLLPAPVPGWRNFTQKSLCPATACTFPASCLEGHTMSSCCFCKPPCAMTLKDSCPLQHLLSPYTSTPPDAACPVPCLNSRMAYCLCSNSRPAPAWPNQQTSLLSNELNHNFSSDLWLPSNLLFLGYSLSAL